jgi:RNA 2',3'-cyclic 3'-phosphodiesterase
MSQLVRAFLSFDIDDATIKKRLSDMQHQAVQTGADLRPVEPDNIHMTIRFLGDITLNLADKILDVMQEVKFKPFPVQLMGLGVFPNLYNPRVLWAGIALGSEQLDNIFKQMEPKLRNLGLPPEHNAFSPHLTIARVRSPKNRDKLAELVTKNERFDFGTLEAKCLRLKRSELTPNGPIYSTLKEFCPTS